MPDEIKPVNPNPYIAEQAGEAGFLPEIEVDRINLNLGHIARTGEYPEDPIYEKAVELAHRNVDLEYEAKHDPLTGLLNRAGFEEAYERNLELARHTPGMRFALIRIDFNKFKDINDTLGHDAGDDLLVGVAHRWASSIHLREHDLFGRIGGDEFIVMGEISPMENDRRHVKDEDEAIEGLIGHIKSEALAAGEELGMNFQGVSAGAAKCEPGMTLKEISAKADEAAMADKPDDSRKKNNVR